MQGYNSQITRLLQQKLVSQGCNTTGIDEIFRSGTASAVISFQIVNYLSAYRVVGPATWSKILGL